MSLVSLNIDGREIEAEEGRSVLDVCLDRGIYIPHLCYHNELSPIGACRLCVVEIDGMDSLVTSCTTTAADGMVIRTTSEKITASRRLSMELMLSGHQADCGTCIKYLNCELQSLKQYLMADELRLRRRSRLFGYTDTNPLFTHEPNKCVLCSRCVRACHELRGVGVLFYKYAHGESYIGVGPAPDKDMTLAEAGCRFCGACAEVCPTGAVLDRAEFGQGKSRKAALVPCANTCPAEIDVPRYLRFIREKKYSAAAAVIREKAPFPLSLGYICAHPCESECRRGQVNEPVSICKLKRYAAENDTEKLWSQNIKKKASTGKKAAIVGAGPAGLTAAYFLTLAGHDVTVFEAMPEAGGMLRYGVPAYRLPRDILADEIADIAALGVEIKTNTPIESLDVLFEKGYEAVLVAIGAQNGVKLRIPGARDGGVLTGAEFLRSVSSGGEAALGERVLMLGGGNVAADCARTARRLGVKSVAMACLEPREAMPATPEELAECEAEGIAIYPASSFNKILREDGRITGVECLNVTSFSFDEDKRLQLETAEDSEHIIEADTVIFAIGQKPAIPEGFEIDKTERGLVETDPYTMKTSRDGVFAAADAVTGTDKAISAIASGKKAAAAIDKYLGGRGKLDIRLAPDQAPEKYLGRAEGFAALKRVSDNKRPPDERVTDFDAVALSCGADEAGAEAERCLQCDLRLKMKPEKFWASY